MDQGSRTSSWWWRAPAIFARALVPFLLATSAAAQTVRPVVVEHAGPKSKGKFELVNEGLSPLIVVIEPKSFDVTEMGEPIYRPLDPRIRLHLSAMTLRIPPRQSRLVFYEAAADSMPAWFVITSTFTGGSKHSGLNVQVELPHTVYLLPKGGLRRGDIQIHTAAFVPSRERVFVDIENTGAAVGRVTRAEVVSAEGERRALPSFPLFPKGLRRLEIPWDAILAPIKLTLRFQGFTIDVPLVTASQTAG